MTPLRSLIAAVVVSALSTGAAISHEFWIDPQDYSVGIDDKIVADLRVGQKYAGASYAYLPSNFRLFEIAMGETRVPVKGRLGDKPALSQSAPGEGLAVVLHQTGNSLLNYDDFESFERFVRHKDALWALDEHRKRGFPTDTFSERYSRYAKSLIAVGNGAGKDQRYGLETEIVALTNPYTDEVSQGVSVQVFYQGRARSDAQLEVFEKAPDGSVEIKLYRTNADGIGRIPVKPAHEYQVDSVVLRVLDTSGSSQSKTVWESLWANLTFAVPG